MLHVEQKWIHYKKACETYSLWRRSHLIYQTWRAYYCYWNGWPRSSDWGVDWPRLRYWALHEAAWRPTLSETVSDMWDSRRYMPSQQVRTKTAASPNCGKRSLMFQMLFRKECPSRTSWVLTTLLSLWAPWGGGTVADVMAPKEREKKNHTTFCEVGSLDGK